MQLTYRAAILPRRTPTSASNQGAPVPSTTTILLFLSGAMARNPKKIEPVLGAAARSVAVHP